MTYRSLFWVGIGLLIVSLFAPSQAESLIFKVSNDAIVVSAFVLIAASAIVEAIVSSKGPGGTEP